MMRGSFGSLAVLVLVAGLTRAQPPNTMSPFPPLAQPPLLAPQPQPCDKSSSSALPEAAPASGLGLLKPAGLAQAAGEPEGGSAAPVVCQGVACGVAESEWVGWVRLEYLLWRLKSNSLPPLATIGPAAGRGVFGSPGTLVPEPFQAIDHDDLHGARFTLGCWLDQYEDFGFEGNYLFTSTDRVAAVLAGAAPENALTVSRPFFNALTRGEDVLPVAEAGRTRGGVSVSADARMTGGEFGFRANLAKGSCYRFDLRGGFRYWELDEGLGVFQASTLAPELAPPGGALSLADQFSTRNRFYGGQLGFGFELRRGGLFLDSRTMLALGGTQQVVHTTGTTILHRPGLPPATATGGFLVVPTNLGRTARDQFTFLPEIGVQVGYQFGASLRIFGGYTFLYATSVVRPGEVLDRVINPGQVPALGGGLAPGTPLRPTVTITGTDFWAQGVSLGVELRY